MPRRPFLILAVLDGFGCRAETEWNAIAQAGTPTFDRLFRECSWTKLEASGLRVGLPEGQMGNSEVGHLNMGAGRVVDQDIVRISKAASSGDIAHFPPFRDAIERLRRTGKSLHLAGLLSDGGVHSLQAHLHGLINASIANGMDVREGLPSIYVHAILDGRDTPPRSALAYVNSLLSFLADRPQAHLASIIGRYYTMDRDRRWERIEKGYELMTLGIGTEARAPLACIERFYQAGISDEFMEPMVIPTRDGANRGKIADGDTLLFFNFRSDRMRQIVTAFKDPAFEGFERSMFPAVDLMSATRYHEEFDFPVLFPPEKVTNHLGEVFAAAGLKQLRIAETEKYAHVTFFFNGGSDEPSVGEERLLVPSAKVATYDLKPTMSVVELADRVVEAIDSRKFDVLVLNIANPDMVGHTGVMPAAIAAVEATDAAVARILDAVERVDGVALITADHGNCEVMFDPETRQPHTAHTSNPVPLILVDRQKRFGTLRPGGALENVAPTLLDILEIPAPPEMTASSLLVRSSDPAGGVPSP